MQYIWQPVFKFVPTDGPDETFDLVALFPDTSGPIRVEASHVPDLTAQVTVNREQRNIPWGWRASCSMTFQVVDTEDLQYLNAIAVRLMQETWTSYLSLDNGATYREVQMAPNGLKGPKPLGGKTFAGAEYELTVQGRELLAEVPALGEGVW